MPPAPLPPPPNMPPPPAPVPPPPPPKLSEKLGISFCRFLCTSSLSVHAGRETGERPIQFQEPPWASDSQSVLYRKRKQKAHEEEEKPRRLQLWVRGCRFCRPGVMQAAPQLQTPETRDRISSPNWLTLPVHPQGESPHGVCRQGQVARRAAGWLSGQQGKGWGVHGPTEARDWPWQGTGSGADRSSVRCWLTRQEEDRRRMGGGQEAVERGLWADELSRDVQAEQR